MPFLIWLLVCCNLHGEAQVSSDVRCVKSLCKYPFECPYHLFYPCYLSCRFRLDETLCARLLLNARTFLDLRRAAQIYGNPVLDWRCIEPLLEPRSARRTCCRHIRPTTSQQRTTKLVLLRTFGVCSSTMTNARKTSRRSVVNVCCNCTGATTKGRTGRTCGDTSNCFLRVAITWT